MFQRVLYRNFISHKERCPNNVDFNELSQEFILGKMTKEEIINEVRNIEGLVITKLSTNKEVRRM